MRHHGAYCVFYGSLISSYPLDVVGRLRAVFQVPTLMSDTWKVLNKYLVNELNCVLDHRVLMSVVDGVTGETVSFGIWL